MSRVYFAAALFNGRENFFNLYLTGGLEKKGHTILLPQRDGFEFNNLEFLLRQGGFRENSKKAVENIIYLLDIGYMIPSSDAIIANLDEPIDEGVAIELVYGRFMGKYLIGYRTDVKSPYGSFSESLGGIHFFPAYQCDVFIRSDVFCKNTEGADRELGILLDKIDEGLHNAPRSREITLDHPQIDKIFQGATLLFGGIGLKDINSPESIQKIANRYLGNRKFFDEYGPNVK